MDFLFEPMREADAREISTWRYEPPYDFYNIASDPNDLAELLTPAHRQNYYSVLSGGELVGFFCFGAEARVPGGNYEDDALDIGLGLRPDLTGKGLGYGFTVAGLNFARERFSPARFRLTVATFNERAIRVYERAGFRRGEIFTRQSTSGDHEFLIMRREA